MVNFIEHNKKMLQMHPKPDDKSMTEENLDMVIELGERLEEKKQELADLKAEHEDVLLDRERGAEMYRDLKAEYEELQREYNNLMRKHGVEDKG